MAKTRYSKPSAPVATPSNEPSEMAPEPQIPFDPPRLIVLPKDVSKQARIISLLHPRTNAKTRYYYCPETGIYEFTRIAAARSAFRSLLVTPTRGSKKGDQEKEGVVDGGYASKTAEMFTATKFDPLFLLLPGLHSEKANAKAGGLFRSPEDIFDDLTEKSKHFGLLVKSKTTRELLERRMTAVCDTVDAGDEKMYRLSEKKLVLVLVEKAKNVCRSVLPKSMEDRFVRKALENPMTEHLNLQKSLQEEEMANKENNPDTPALDSSESQSSIVTSISTATDATGDTSITTPESMSQSDVPPEIISLLRIRISLSYITETYLSTSLAKTFESILKSPASPVDFELLEKHLAHLANIRAEVVKARSLMDNTRKRNLYDEDDEAAESRAAKKAKKEEEERGKKAGESRGVRDLKKVDTKGMKKLSFFFKKKDVVK